MSACARHIPPYPPLYYTMKHKTLITLANLVIVLVLVALAVTVTFASRTEAAFAPVRQGTAHDTVALTFNVYIGDQYVREIVEVLRTYSIPATFFLGGSYAVKHPETCQILVQNGLCVGSHGYSHLDHGSLDYAANVKELNKAKHAIKEVCGVDVTLFAPPSGAYNAAALKAAEDLGYTVVMWSKDAIDWRDQDEQIIFERTTRDKQSGDIILMHPTAATVAALPRVIESYLSSGFRFITIEDLIAA